jgi:hypothetical protein
MTIDRRHLLGASTGLVTAAGLNRIGLTPAFAQSAPAYKPDEGKVASVQQIFIELYNYGPAWAKCSENERADFAKKIIDAVSGMKAAGIDVIAYGKNARETDRRAPYDFFCVYRVPSAEFQREAERRIAASGWYDYFEQVNVSGPAEDFVDVLLANAKMARPN